jgi:hypothetical protein
MAAMSRSWGQRVVQAWQEAHTSQNIFQPGSRLCTLHTGNKGKRSDPVLLESARPDRN